MTGWNEGSLAYDSGLVLFELFLKILHNFTFCFVKSRAKANYFTCSFNRPTSYGSVMCSNGCPIVTFGYPSLSAKMFIKINDLCRGLGWVTYHTHFLSLEVGSEYLDDALQPFQSPFQGTNLCQSRPTALATAVQSFQIVIPFRIYVKKQPSADDSEVYINHWLLRFRCDVCRSEWILRYNFGLFLFSPLPPNCHNIIQSFILEKRFRNFEYLLSIHLQRRFTSNMRENSFSKKLSLFVWPFFVGVVRNCLPLILLTSEVSACFQIKYQCSQHEVILLFTVFLSKRLSWRYVGGFRE